MKIEKVESILAGNGHYVRIQTDSGLVGIGQSSCWAYLEAVDKIVEKFGEYLVGKDPLVPLHRANRRHLHPHHQDIEEDATSLTFPFNLN